MSDDDKHDRNRVRPEQIRVEVYMHGAGEDKVLAKLGEILRVVKRQGVKMGAEFDDLEAKVSANTTVVDSLGAVIDGIKAKLDAAIAANDPSAFQRLSDALGESNEQMAAWVVANTVAEDETPAE